MVMARTAAMAFNRWCDADFDANNRGRRCVRFPRVALSSRAVSAGYDSRRGWFSTRGWDLLSVQRKHLAPVRSRCRSWPSCCSIPWRNAGRNTCIGGSALPSAYRPICAWLAITGRVDLPPVLLGLAIAFWVAGFDILYALQDFEFDRGVGLKSIPARLGPTKARVIAITSHLVMLGLLAGFVIVTPELGPASWMAMHARSESSAFSTLSYAKPSWQKSTLRSSTPTQRLAC